MVQSELDAVSGQSKSLADPSIYIGDEPPVDIVEFVESSEFLGSQVKCDPEVLQLLWLIEQEWVRDAYVEVGKGSGKSLIGSIVPVYGAYLILKMKEPQKFFDLSPATIIATINVSISEKQAKEVIFNQIKALVMEAPWFKAHVKFEPLTQEVKFPERRVTLYCGHSNSTAFLGFATVRAVMDEANYMMNTSNKNVAETLFTALKGSLLTRFPDFYKLLAISSAATPGAWLHQEVESTKRDGQEIQLINGGVKGRPNAKPARQQNGVEEHLDSIMSGLFEDMGPNGSNG